MTLADLLFTLPDCSESFLSCGDQKNLQYARQGTLRFIQRQNDALCLILSILAYDTQDIVGFLAAACWADHLPELSVVILVQLLSCFGWSWVQPCCGQGLEGALSWVLAPIPQQQEGGCRNGAPALGPYLVVSSFRHIMSGPRTRVTHRFLKSHMYFKMYKVYKQQHVAHSTFPGAHFIASWLKIFQVGNTENHLISEVIWIFLHWEGGNEG